jgi:twitching motility protein PilT
VDAANLELARAAEALRVPPAPPAPPAPEKPATAPSLAGPGDGPSLDALLALAAGTHGARPEALHVATGRPVLARIATDLAPRLPPTSAEVVERLLRDLLAPALRARLDAEGACEVVFSHETHGRFLVRASSHVHGRRLLLRALPREVPTVASLGLPAPIAELAAKGRGLVLVAAPRRGGKTSTIAALVDAIGASSSRRVLVVEGRSEVIHGRRAGLVTQHAVRPGAPSNATADGSTEGGVGSFEHGARLASRCDADVVVLDADVVHAPVVRAALELVESGKLVVLGLACSGAARATDRLLDAFAPSHRAPIAERLASALAAVVGQRLVPSADRARLVPAFELVPSSLPVYAAVREGRAGALAALLASPRDRLAGGVHLDDALAALVRTQAVTLDVARAFSDHPSELDALAAASGRKS